MDQVYRASVTDLNKVLRALGDGPAESKQQALMELLPEIGAQYANVAAAVAATFADEVLTVQGLNGPAAVPAEAPPVESWYALAGAATAPGIPNQLYFDLLTGGLINRLTRTAADTVVLAGEAVGVTGYQRVTRPGCCDFCAMLASRGDAYESEGSASRVRGRGGRTRGSRQVGQAFHDHCKCVVVPVHGGNRLEMDAVAEEQRKAYTEAYNAVSGDLKPQTTLKNGRMRTVFVDSKGVTVSDKERTRRILSHMRRQRLAAQ